MLLAFLLYQVFVPGSMFRYWLCRRGSISGDLWVTITPYSALTEVGDDDDGDNEGDDGDGRDGDN